MMINMTNKEMRNEAFSLVVQCMFGIVLLKMVFILLDSNIRAFLNIYLTESLYMTFIEEFSPEFIKAKIGIAIIVGVVSVAMTAFISTLMTSLFIDTYHHQTVPSTIVNRFVRIKKTKTVFKMFRVQVLVYFIVSLWSLLIIIPMITPNGFILYFLVIPAIIAFYSYSQSSYIAYESIIDNCKLSASQCLKKSRKMMFDLQLNLFGLDISIYWVYAVVVALMAYLETKNTTYQHVGFERIVHTPFVSYEEHVMIVIALAFLLAVSYAIAGMAHVMYYYNLKSLFQTRADLEKQQKDDADSLVKVDETESELENEGDLE